MDPYTVTTAADTGSLGVLMGFLGTFSLVFLAIGILLVVCMWRIFVKAGKPGWAAIIPVYNLYILLQIIGKPWWWLFGYFIGFIPTIGWILTVAFGVIVALELARKFGKSNVFGVVGLWLFAFVGYPMLAFGKAQYDPSAPAVVNFPSGSPVPSAQPVAPQAPVETDPQDPITPQV